MKRSSKYYALFERLSHSGLEEISLSLGEIEHLLGQALPPSARSRRDWWGNRSGTLQASAWMEAGYHVTVIDLENERVTFGKPIRQYFVQRDGDVVLWDSNLIKALRLHMGLNQAQFAEQMGVRQQTVSEWENDIYTPTRATCKHLMLVAEGSNFRYGEKT
jgi:DNA-binding XRE family transcriptional regulator